MKKSHERTILDFVFGSCDTLTVTESEQPDFRCDAATGFSFGVEVTELFLSESVARLRRIPKYGMELLTNERYRHKDDRRTISVQNVIYRSGKTGEERELKAITTGSYSMTDVVERFTTVLAGKNAKFEEYARTITPVDLIINDVDHVSGFSDVADLVRPLYRGDALTQINNSPFREIYLVTSSEGQQVSIPLRAQLFVTEVHAFRGMFKEFYGDKLVNITHLQFVESLGTYLTRRFTDVKYEVTASGQMRIVFASIAFLYGDGGMQIYDISCDPEGNRKDLAPDLDENIDAELVAYVEERRKKVFCIIPLLLPVDRDPHDSRTE